MSFSFRRSNAKQTTTDIAEDEQSDRWQFGFSGINFEEDEFEFENAPDWPEEIERSEEVSAQHSPEQL